jgi:DNA polymerase I-like protein with 3'-5' exonuclease and polymerase domains
MTFIRTPVDYCLDRPLPEMEQWMAELGYTPDMPLAVDIETPETDKINEEDSDDPEKTSYTIIRCGFSFRSGTAASYPWVEPYITFTRRLLSMARICVLWNGGFDSPRLSRAGCPIKGKIIDGMWMFHFLQSDLPKSLEFVAPFYTDVAPWKHLSQAEPAFYNATDNDVTLRCYYAMREWLVRQGRWERFIRHCSDTAEILGEMSTAGVLIDVAARSALQDGLRSEIAVLDSKIQVAVPRELLPEAWLKTNRAFTRVTDTLDEREWEPVEVRCECKHMRKSTGRCLVCDGAGIVSHFRKFLPFNWNSTDQTQELAKHYGFTIPKKRGEDREALESKTLRRFGKRKPVFLDIWNARKRYKLISTYDWTLDGSGRVHTKFGFHPSTWRKSSRDPNLQNIPANGDLAGAFRRTIIASPGHALIEADSKSIEAVLVGYDASDAEYIRIAKAGVHDFFMSHVRAHHEGGRGIDRSLPLDELVKACKEAKDYDKSLPKSVQRRDHCKKTVHGSNYGLTPYGMADEYQDLFPRQRDAEELQEMYFALFPKIKQWMRTTRELADRQTYLDNHYQYRHYFYAVTKWNSKYQKFDLGTDAKRCIAFLPQSDASAIQSDDLLTLADDPIVRAMLRLIIHDSFVLECPLDMLDYTCSKLHSTMSRPRPELGGLEIGVEIKYGSNLQDTSLWEPTREVSR